MRSSIWVVETWTTWQVEAVKSEISPTGGVRLIWAVYS